MRRTSSTVQKPSSSQGGSRLQTNSTKPPGGSASTCEKEIDALRIKLFQDISRDSLMTLSNSGGGEKYEGQVDGRQRRCGKGVLRWPNGNCYIGEWLDGCMSGQGVFLYGIEEDRYEGEFKDDKKHGVGKYIFANGNNYCGQFLLDKRHGKGKYTWICGDMYDGDWKDGRMEGFGITVYANGNKYEGNFVADKRDGHGTLVCTDGLSYTGEWSKNQRHGSGTLRFPSGDYYEGNWAQDKKNGKGKDVFINGNIFEGEYVENVKCGLGEMKYSNGDHYKGGWKDDKMHGEGEYGFANGFRYSGSWIADARSGFGVYTFPNGHVYEGEWLRDKRHGKGKLTLAPQKDCYVGTWVEGKMQGSFSVFRTFSKGTKPLEPIVNTAARRTEETGSVVSVQDLLLSSQAKDQYVLRKSYEGHWEVGVPSKSGIYYFYPDDTVEDGSSKVIRFTGEWIDVTKKYEGSGSQASVTKKNDGTVDFPSQQGIQEALALLKLVELDSGSSDEKGGGNNIPSSSSSTSSSLFPDKIDGNFLISEPKLENMESFALLQMLGKDLAQIVQDHTTPENAQLVQEELQSYMDILLHQGERINFNATQLTNVKSTLAFPASVDVNVLSPTSTSIISALQIQIQSLTVRIQSETELLDSNQSELHQLKAAKSGFKTIDSLREEIASVQKQKEQLRKKSQNEEKKASAFLVQKQQLAALKAKLQEFQVKELQPAQQECATLKEKYDKNIGATKSQLLSEKANVKAKLQTTDANLKDLQKKLTQQSTSHREKLKTVNNGKTTLETKASDLEKKISEVEKNIAKLSKELKESNADRASEQTESLRIEEEIKNLTLEKQKLGIQKGELSDTIQNLQLEIEKQHCAVQEAAHSDEKEKLQMEKELSRVNLANEIVESELQETMARVGAMTTECGKLEKEKAEGDLARASKFAALQKQLDRDIIDTEGKLKDKEKELSRVQKAFEEKQQTNKNAGGGGLTKGGSVVGRLRDLRRQSGSSTPTDSSPTPTSEQFENFPPPSSSPLDEDTELVNREMQKRVKSVTKQLHFEKAQFEELKVRKTQLEEELKEVTKKEKRLRKGGGKETMMTTSSSSAIATTIYDSNSNGSTPPDVSVQQPNGSSTAMSSLISGAGREAIVSQLIKARANAETLAHEKEKLLMQVQNMEESNLELASGAQETKQESIAKIIASLGPDDWRHKYLVEQLDSKAKSIASLEAECAVIESLEAQIASANDAIALLTKDSQQSAALQRHSSSSSMSQRKTSGLGTNSFY